MSFKSKLRRIGNSQGVYIPKEVITDYHIGDVIELEVITKQVKEVITPSVKQPEVITDAKTPFNTNWCKKHRSFKGSCKCL